MTIGLEHYLIVSVMLFCFGLLGVTIRRNLIVMYMGLELMLNAQPSPSGLFPFSGQPGWTSDGVFIITVAAAEVAVGLALIVALTANAKPTT